MQICITWLTLTSREALIPTLLRHYRVQGLTCPVAACFTFCVHLSSRAVLCCKITITHIINSAK